MIEKIIDGIKYRLDEETLTAKVVQDITYAFVNLDIPKTVLFEKVSYHVTSIGDNAFSRCSSLTSIVIPDGVRSIGKGAFRGCKSLTDITFQGTIAQWKEIALDKDWKDNIPAKVVHCTDGDVEI